VRVAPAKFAAARSGAGVAKNHPAKTGTTITYTDSKAAAMTFTVLRHAAGVKSAKRCIAHFTGRVAAHKRRPGQHTLSAVPKADGVPGHAATALFRSSS
jgi:hypothetical protein